MAAHPDGKDERPRRKTILIVDDEFIIHELYALFLENEPVDLIHDYDGQNVPRLVEKSRPDLILLDIGIPGTDGRDICRRIKENPRIKDIPVIMVTGDYDPRTRSSGCESGPDDYIAKPASRQVVMKTLHKHLRLNEMNLSAKYRTQKEH